MSLRIPIALLGGIAALVLMNRGSLIPQAQAQGGNLPVYTSPIDVTGLRIQLRAVAPDRDSGDPANVPIPGDLLGPKMKQLLGAPLSTQLDQFWAVNKDPKTGKTPREQACDGIIERVNQEIRKKGASYSAYDISCDLASTGKVLVKQVGSTMYLGYLLTHNTLTFAVTSPYTCRAKRGTLLCPNDPRFRVTFASEIVTVIRTPGICQLHAEGGTVNTQAVNIDSTNGSGAIASAVDDLFLGHQFSAAERAIEDTERQTPLPLDAAFAELRTSDACTGKGTPTSRVLSAFRDFETEIDLRQGILFKVIHVGIAAPTLDAPNPGAAASTPRVPSFTRPMIATAQPLVTAGDTVRVSGQYFPPNLDLATALPVTLQHGGYGQNSIILGGLCLGGATELEWGPANGPLKMQRLPGDAQGACPARYDAINLTPATAYQFRARDCDPITCSPWSAPLKVTTAPANATSANVVLTLDEGTPLGTTTVTAQGTFAATITLPAGTTPGPHTLHAVNGDAKADASLQVVAPGGGVKGSLMMVGLLQGETGCPNHPISSTQTGASFTLFGTGFAAGTVTIQLDSATGTVVGTAPVRTDGSICQVMPGVAADQAGAHELVAVQNGTVQAQTAITFVLPSGVR